MNLSIWQIIQLVFQIGKVLWDVSPELYEAFKKIVALFPQTPEMVVAATKTTGKDLLPDITDKTAEELQKALDEYLLTVNTP